MHIQVNFCNTGFRVAATAATLVLFTAMPAAAQSIWGGIGSTTATSDYNLGSNWSNPPVGAPPVSASQAAFFSSTGSSTVTVTAPIAVSDWTFVANSQSYTVTGEAINFGLGGLTNSASAGHVISISNNLGGAGVQVVQANTGTLILSGSNTYTGDTFINSGMLALTGTGSIAASSKVVDNANLDFSLTTVDSSIKSLAGTTATANVVLGNHTLTLTAANDGFFGVVSGDGALALSAGTETLGGINTYLGTTTINGGTLIIDGSIATSPLTTVNSGGTLAGTGTVGNTTVNSGGAFAPGNGTAGSSMTVSGNLAFQSGALYLIALSPATSSFASVSGTATLGGATVGASFAAGSYVAKQYTILTAASVSGTFNPATANTNLPSGFTTSLSYDATHAYLNLALNLSPAPGKSAGLNINQQNVANAVVGFFNSTGSIPMVFGGLSPAGLTQISGELPTGSQQATFDAMTQFMGVMSDPFVAGRGDRMSAGASATSFVEEFDAANAFATKDPPRSQSQRDAYAAIYRKAAPAMSFHPGWSVWAAGYGGSQTTSGNATLGSNSANSSLGATAVGADYRFSPNTIAGFALAGGGTSFSVINAGSGRSDLFQAGAFVRHTVGAAYLTGALAYGWQDITTNRAVAVAGIDQLQAHFDANAFSGRIEGGYRFVTPWMGVTPYAAAQFATFDLPAYAERATTGSNNFALAYGARSVTDPRSEVGVRTDKSWAMPESIFTLRGRLAWAHDYNPDRSIGATFQTLPGASFVVNGAKQATDAALVTASAETKWMNGWSAAATFEGEFSNVTRSYAGKGVVRYQW
ncbi:autotransporter domain-containing protein [Bradyrhizobium manausense]|uniref:autotransporter outer membrane beta-barrel domain-containing protein n=1 Tax=Bradyrhizobium manausense TaxID=989370 RepID=UPI002011CE29|nr:autotransporter domain-containing protein [Bradyrhizobium manausense]